MTRSTAVRRFWMVGIVSVLGVSGAVAAAWQVHLIKSVERVDLLLPSSPRAAAIASSPAAVAVQVTNPILPTSKRAPVRAQPIVADKYHDAEGHPWPMKSEKRRTTLGPDSPDEALRWKQMFEKDEFGNIPPDGLMNASKQMRAMRARTLAADAALTSAGVEPDPIAGIASNSWTWAGPGNIGGRTRAIAVHPTTTNTIFAGSVAGGIWKSTDGGSNWNVVDDFMANLAISSIVFQPGTANVMFAGTGEGFANQDAIRGAGIFRSTDGGTTWNQLPNTANTSFNLVNELAFSPDGSILMAATGSGFFRSTNNGDTWTLSTGGTTNAQDVKFLPGSNSVVVGGGRAHNAFFSTDGGVTFQAATIPLQPGGGTGNVRVELAVAPSNGSIVYASVAAGGTASTPPAEIWQSTDSGVTYSMVSTNSGTSLLGAQGWYDNAIWVDPVNENNVIVGGVSLSRSTDGGVTWASMPISGGGMHADQHVIVQDPGYDGAANTRVYFGNDGGLYKIEALTFSGTQVSTRLNNNYGVTQFYGGDGLVSTGRLFGGTQDNGTPTFTGNPQGWTSLAGSDGGMATADQVNNVLYGETQNLGVHRSTLPSTATTIAACSGAAPLQDACASTPLTNFIAPLLLDPNNPDRLLAGGQQLWLSTNPRATPTSSVAWASIKPSVTSNISAIAVAKSNSDLIWVGHSNGNVYLAEDGTSAIPTWTQKDTNSPGLPNRAVSSINVDPTDVNTAYVSFGSFNTQNLWVTHDRGATWAVATGSGGGALPVVPVRWVLPHPTISGWIYAATDVGIFTSENGGNTWQVPHDGPANVAVFQLFFLGNTLVAATHGRGMYTAVVSPPSVPPGITTQPVSQTVGAGQRATLSVAAQGSAPLSFQWFRGASPSTASPVPGATSSVFTTPPLFDTTSYWVRVTNSFGTASSNTAAVTVDKGTTIFNTTLRVPKCGMVGASCDSGPALILGKGTMAGGPEPNQPNTINSSCSDGNSGNFHVDESIDRIKISTLDGLPFAAGKTVKIDVTVWADAAAFASDHLDLYGAADAANPVWNLITTLTPSAGGAQVLTVSSYVLPAGTLQAIRANFRFNGSTSPCIVGGFDDHDDLTFAVNPSVGTQIVQNGDFSAGLTGWTLYETPDIVHNNGAGGIFQFHKASPTTTASGQAVIFQETGVPVGTDKALSASFQIGNLDNVRKRISVLVVDSNYTDLSVCTFWMAPNAPMRTYQMRTHPTRGWASAAIYFYAASDGLGDYQLDSVSLTIDGTASLMRTDCIDPTRPTPPGGAAGPNLLTNGDFASGLVAPWVPFFDIQQQIAGGELQFIQPGAPGSSPGGLLQSTGQSMTASQIMTATFKLGNSSAQRKRVTILLHDLDFSDLSACSFYLAPGQALSDYAMRTFVTRPTGWTNASISIYGATPGPEQWTRIDDVTLSRTPAGPVLGTECFEPFAPGPVAPVDRFVPTVPSSLAAPRASASQSGSSSGSSSGGGFRVVPETPDDPFSWIVEATAGGRSTMSWAQPVDLTDVRAATLKFESSLSSIASPASVQVSLDGDTWQTLASLSNGSATMIVDLNDFVGRLIYVRFVFDAEPPPMGVEADVWRIGRVVIDVTR